LFDTLRCCLSSTRINGAKFSLSNSVSHLGTTEEEFSFYIGNERADFSLLFEKMLSTNDENFPVIMEFLRINNIVPSIAEAYRFFGYTFINSTCDITDFDTRWRLAMNLKYLKANGCDLNLEMFNYLRSLTFGGKLVKRGEHFLLVIKFLLPFCTDFFIDLGVWRKIRYFCADTKEIREALDFLITSYGSEKNYKFLPPQARYEPFTLKHLARNKVRENVWSEKRMNLSFYALCERSLPVMLFNYMNFVD
jgi:hypothetical protein